ncbi:MAG: hypothetical protein EOO71_27460 [Myxococcaceae bacterium]|nr:MAG: hypothetical protein EOO71_27460 [Myxococcaceae bacterium]
MAIIVQTSNPSALVTAIRKAIDDGNVATWSYDDDGDFTHTPAQWSKKAWLRPYVGAGVLSFGLVGQKGVAMIKEIYGIYHGRFIEMLLSHFDDSFSNASATALQDKKLDLFK